MPGTDNSLLGAKVALRIKHLPGGPVKVLDAFGGYGVVWQEVAAQTKRTDIYRVGIDKEKRLGCVHGDNRKWLKGMTLSLFDVIDLDAYGMPFDQIEILFKRKFKGVVFFTFIQAGLRQVVGKLLRANGITKEMEKKCDTLFGQIGWQLWLDYLANNGVKKVFWMGGNFQRASKHYGCFVLT
jgi:hypothetical protein